MPSAAATSRASASRTLVAARAAAQDRTAAKLDLACQLLASAAGVSLAKSPSTTIVTAGWSRRVCALAPM